MGQGGNVHRSEEDEDLAKDKITIDGIVDHRYCDRLE
jgi:hypothetical protein